MFEWVTAIADKLKTKAAVTTLKKELKTSPLRPRKYEDVVKVDRIKALFDQFREHPLPNIKTGRITVASGYGSQHKHQLILTSTQLDFLRGTMGNPTSAIEERIRMGRAMAYVERLQRGVNDRASIDFSGNGDPTQQDCVDNSMNGTSVLMLLAGLGLIHYHDIYEPTWRGNLFVALHYVVQVREIGTGEYWILDMDKYGHGKEPLIQRRKDFEDI